VDFETSPQHQFNLIVQDNGSGGALSTTFPITVNINNINEAPTLIVIDGSSCGDGNNVCSFQETASTIPVSGTVAGTNIGTLKAVDPECAGTGLKTPTECGGVGVALSDSISFTVASQIPGDYFSIAEGTNVLKLTSAVDFEALGGSGGSVSVTVRVTDSASHAYTQVVTMVIQDVAEPPSGTDLVCYVREGTAVNQIAGTTGADGVSNDICMIAATAAGEEELQFSIVSFSPDDGASDASLDPFDVNDCAGIITVKSGLEYDGGSPSGGE